MSRYICPFCMYDIPKYARVCGSCRNDVAWRDGNPRTFEEAERQDSYEQLIWQNWPWIIHVPLTIAFATGLIWDNRTEMTFWGSLGYIVASMLFTLVPIWIAMWVWVRIRYPVD